MQGTIDNPTVRHRSAHVDRVARSIDAHPAGARLRQVPPPDADRIAPIDGAAPVDRWDDDEGSLVTEYGLLAVVAATVAGVIIQWASGGALVTLFNALLRQARALVGA
jgi:Flp pilus assembly pilin Flp